MCANFVNWSFTLVSVGIPVYDIPKRVLDWRTLEGSLCALFMMLRLENVVCKVLNVFDAALFEDVPSNVDTTLCTLRTDDIVCNIYLLWLFKLRYFKKLNLRSW